VKTVQILIDENFKNYAVTELSRPHVKNACNSYINADKSGFEYAIEVSELANGNHTVTAITTGNDGSYAQQTMGFNVNVSNSGSKVTALTLIGSFLGGIKDAAADNLQGMFQIITHPIKSAEAVGFLLYAANNKDSEEYKMLMEMVKNELDEIANKFTNGDGNVKARMIGRAVGELFIAVVGPKGIKQGLELLSKVSKGTKLGALVQKGMTAAEALNITERAAEAVNKIRTVASDFLKYVKDSIIDLGDRIAYKPALAGANDDAFYYISKSEISDSNKLESIAKSEGRLVDEDCEDVVKTSRVISMEERIAEYDKIKYNYKVSSSNTETKASDILRAELKAGKITDPPYATAAHHIVAWDAKEAQIARDILNEYGIDVNSASNGVLLPWKGNEYVTTEAMHSGGHSFSYYNQVNERLLAVERLIKEKNVGDTMAKILIGDELQSIRKDLLNGILKIHN
jgi:hypothetical protein